jgi:uncharacterized protein
MIAVDTNILIQAHRSEAPYHEPMKKLMSDLAQGASLWAIPWPCLHEFYSIVTHPTRFKPPTPSPIVMEQMLAWRSSPSVRMLGEAPQHLETLIELLHKGKVTGPMVHDARIAAICIAHGVREFWTLDRDFSRFPQLRCRNPLVQT